MHTIRITKEKLDQLKMLADWQLKEQGIDPESVTMACLDGKWVEALPSTEGPK